LWIRADFILDIEHFGKVAIHKIFKGEYSSIQYYKSKQDYMENTLTSEFPGAIQLSIREIDAEGKSAYKIIDRYVYEGDPSLIYAVHLFGEEAQHGITCIHPSFSFCVEQLLEDIVATNEMNYCQYAIETWKDGVKTTSIKIG
jgi:hypothetical protein